MRTAGSSSTTRILWSGGIRDDMGPWVVHGGRLGSDYIRREDLRYNGQASAATRSETPQSGEPGSRSCMKEASIEMARDRRWSDERLAQPTRTSGPEGHGGQPFRTRHDPEELAAAGDHPVVTT